MAVTIIYSYPTKTESSKEIEECLHVSKINWRTTN